MTTKTLLRFVVLITTVSACCNLIAQSQTRFNYQAQIRDAGDAAFPNAPVDIRVSIRMGASTGDDVYREVHSDTTSSIGLVNILVGAGSVEVGDIDAIAWGDTTYYLKIDADFGGGFTDMGGAPIASVPIAEFARRSQDSYWSLNTDGEIYHSGTHVGINTDTPSYPLDVRDGAIRIRNTSNSKIIMEPETSTFGSRIWVRDENSEDVWFVDLMQRDEDNRVAFRSALGGGTVLSMYHDGRTEVKCLEILGGCDINERFNSTELLEPGTVVIANSDRPGEVCMTDKPYDQRVVGAISGANGIKPGLTLTQEGTVLDGTHPVALDGRVYVKVTGPVEVGDLLTTSSEHGRAMAVKNRKKAFGAVIGKALESDADDDGLVLMLVQPR